MLGEGEDLLRRALFDLLAAQHDDDPVGDLGDHRHVVGDEQHRHPDLALEQLDEVEDLGLDGHVERGGGLVGDEECGAAAQRHRDHRALAHAAGELMRVLLELALRLRDAHELEHLQRERTRLGAALLLVQHHRFGDLVPHPEHRVQRGHRLLEDHRDLVAADVAERRGRLLRHVHHAAAAAPEPDRAGDDAPAGGVGEPQQRHGRDRLPRARFADQRHRLAAVDVEPDAVDRLDDMVLHAEVHAQIAHLHQPALVESGRPTRGADAGGGGRVHRLRALRRSRGSRVSRSPSPSRLTPSTTTVRKMPGKRRIQNAIIT